MEYYSHKPPEKRQALAPLLGQRHTFTGTVDRIKVDYHDGSIVLVLAPVLHEGRKVADHALIPLLRPAKLTAGQQVTIEAEVDTYHHGTRYGLCKGLVV